MSRQAPPPLPARDPEPWSDDEDQVTAAAGVPTRNPLPATTASVQDDAAPAAPAASAASANAPSAPMAPAPTNAKHQVRASGHKVTLANARQQQMITKMSAIQSHISSDMAFKPLLAVVAHVLNKTVEKTHAKAHAFSAFIRKVGKVAVSAGAKLHVRAAVNKDGRRSDKSEAVMTLLAMAIQKHVRDSGQIIDADQLKLVFEMVVRSIIKGDSSVKKPYGRNLENALQNSDVQALIATVDFNTIAGVVPLNQQGKADASITSLHVKHGFSDMLTPEHIKNVVQDKTGKSIAAAVTSGALTDDMFKNGSDIAPAIISLAQARQSHTRMMSAS